MGYLLAFLFGFIPALINSWVIYSLDRYEKEPKRLLIGVFLWGAILAAGTAFVVNSLLGLGVYIFTSSKAAVTLTTGSVFAPVIEESLKGMAVLIIFLAMRREFDSILDGIIYAAIVALGFAATENVYYIYTYGYVPDGFTGLFIIAFIRVILIGWQHPFYTAFIGIGLAVARFSSSWARRIMAVIFGWGVAVLVHSIHNTLSYFTPQSAGLLTTVAFDWTGWLAMIIFILVINRRESKLVKKYLEEEVLLGTLTAQQYSTAISPSAQLRARLVALQKRGYRATARFYQDCGELVHKKNQLARLGDEGGNQAIIDQLRAELKQLSPDAAFFAPQIMVK